VEVECVLKGVATVRYVFDVHVTVVGFGLDFLDDDSLRALGGWWLLDYSVVVAPRI
jgi:hypothetical protein